MSEIIEVKNLKKYYKGVRAVDDISFSVEEGSLFSFLGENGAGKSTTINVICTVLEKTSGKVSIAGYDLDKEEDNIRNIIGIVFQQGVLDDELTVYENLCSRASYYGLFGKALKDRIQELSKVFELGEIMNRRYKNLSGGQRRRVDIARALINNPKILFLDEPTTGLDPKTRVMVWDIINKLRKENKLTVFLTTHYMEETKDADQIVILDHGKVVAMGTPHSLKNTYSKNKLLWHIEQSKKNDELLSKLSIPFTFEADHYIIPFDENKQIINFLYENKQIITDYEIVKGDMDDVFLNVTGKKLGD